MEEKKNLNPQLIIRVYDPKGTPTSIENTAGMVFPLKEDGSMQDDIADVFIAKIDAAPLPESRTTIVTALLRNDFIMSEAVCTANTKEEYNFEKDVEVGVEIIKKKIQEHLRFLMTTGKVTAERILKIDEMSREPKKEA